MSNANDFVIENGVLKKYKGPGGDVVIPEGVKSIYGRFSEGAFYGCSSLTSVVIPEGVTSIGGWAFYGCSSLTSVIIPDSVRSIGGGAFSGCGRAVFHISNEAANRPENYVIKKGVLKDYKGPGGDVIIPEGVTSIGRGTFWDCSSLTSVVIPRGVTSIRKEAFYCCSSLTRIVIPEGVTSIEKGVFHGCNSLTSVIIPEGVTSIGDNAFYGCRSLTSVVIPEGVTSIGDSAFGWCKSLMSVVIPEGVTSIGDSAFDGCSSLTSVVIPEGVTSIGDSAFDGCSSLTSVVIPEGVTSIGNRVFQNCSSLTSVVIPRGVTSIKGNIFSGAFGGCSSLMSVVIPDSVTSIGWGAFSGCKGLADNQGFRSAGDVLLEYCGDNENAVIPDGIKYIDKGAFRGNEKLTSVILPSSVKIIGDWVFGDCKKLTSVVIPESVTSIGENVFSGCGALQELIVPKKLKSLGKEPFGDHLPESLRPQIGMFYHALTDGTLKSYILVSSVWESLDEGLQAEIFLTRQGKPLMQAYGECIKSQDLSRIGNAVLERIQGNKPTSKECTAAANYMILFYENAPLDLLKQLYDGLKKAKTGARVLKSVEEHVALMEKLGSAIEVDQSLLEVEQRVMEHLLAEKMNLKDLEAKLKNYYGLEYSDLPVLCGQDGNKLKPFVLAWLLMAHETQAKRWGSIVVKAALEKPGLSPDAAKIVAMLNQESFQAALMALADEHLVQYQNTKKKFLCFPICRYADETTMVELTKRAPKWSTSVSGNDAPPLSQMREAVRYSDTRAAMLFAERYHELDQYAALRGMTEDEMRDKYLSDVGLDEQGGKVYDLGNQTVTARLQQDLSYLFELTNGKTMKSLPKKGADAEKYSTAKADFDEMRKATKKILKSRGQVLFQDFLSGRERGAAEWQEAYLKNPLLRKAASLIVWAQGDKTFTLRDGIPIDSGEQPYTITDVPVRVAHPMEMTSNDTAAWQKYFNAHGLKQPFVQVWEPVIDPATIREDRYKGAVIPFYRFSGQEKHGITVEDYDFHNEIEIALKGCIADVERIDLWRHEINSDDRFEINSFRFELFTRQVNHLVAYFDRITVWERIRKDDASVMQFMDQFTLAQITEFIATAQEANAVNVLAALLEYKNNKFSDFDPMEEFTLEW